MKPVSEHELQDTNDPMSTITDERSAALTRAALFEASRAALEAERRREPPSRALSLIAAYFNISGVLNAAVWIAVNVAAVAGVKAFAPLSQLSPLRTIFVLAVAGMYLRVGQLLHQRRREGALWALLALAPGIVTRIVSHTATFSSTGIWIPLIGIALIAMVWKELE